MPTKRKVPSLDVETQCAAQKKEGGTCHGSLACKRHSFAAKRAVAGRSRPFDELLKVYLEGRMRAQVQDQLQDQVQDQVPAQAQEELNEVQE